MGSDPPTASPLDGYLRVFQVTMASLVVAVWALTAAVFPNQPLAVVLGLLSVLLLAYATLLFADSSGSTEKS